jgi:alpha/beta superfamily hydrolase
VLDVFNSPQKGTMEKKITFNSGQLVLEAMYKKLSECHGAIVTHPHPVVESLVTCFNKKNYTTLRFNFRGVGGSDGKYDAGVGEQEDILSASTLIVPLSSSSFFRSVVSCLTSPVYRV